MDLAAAEAAGIRDPAGRAGLLEYLEAKGFSLDEMAEAERNGRLFALAGDAIIQSGPAVHSLRTAAQALGLPEAEVAHAWAVLGLTVAGNDQPALTEADLDGLRTWVAMRGSLGTEVALGLLRVIGTSMARIAEAESSAIRSSTVDIMLHGPEDELRTAQAFGELAPVVPRIGAFMDAVHRQHIATTRSYFEAVVQGDDATSVRCGVGFADLSGFTGLTQRLSLPELSGLLTAFGSTASDVVHEHGGRVVKLLGDAVMWVNADPARLAEVAAHLVAHPLARKAGIEVRAGIAFGPVLAMDGDYFGQPVNLAARLVAVAEPGQILASADLCELLPDWSTRAHEPVPLRGFAEPVTPYELLPPGG
jgi:class 3 adenylate cyclase